MIDIVGGIYREILREPVWSEETYGSGGRAAAAISGLADSVTLYSYVCEETQEHAQTIETLFKVDLSSTQSKEEICFDYFHTLAQPQIFPDLDAIRKNQPIEITGQNIVRYGFIEGDAITHGKKVVYDPQSERDPQHYHANGSTAEELAIVLNQNEAARLTKVQDPGRAADKLLDSEKYDVVIIKRGPFGAYVSTNRHHADVPAFKTPKISSTIGSGDVFSAIFGFYWMEKNCDPFEAAMLASEATAFYCHTHQYKIPSSELISQYDYAQLPTKTSTVGKRVYLAGPFFDMAQRWRVNEVRQLLQGIGINVFSPIHDVGPVGSDPTSTVAKDLAGIRKCDCMIALIDGGDPGTLFEIGYANKCGRPVVALAENVTEENLTMISGSQGLIHGDLASAVYETVWQLIEV